MLTIVWQKILLQKKTVQDKARQTDLFPLKWYNPKPLWGPDKANLLPQELLFTYVHSDTHTQSHMNLPIDHYQLFFPSGPGKATVSVRCSEAGIYTDVLWTCKHTASLVKVLVDACVFVCAHSYPVCMLSPPPCINHCPPALMRTKEHSR